MTAHQEAIIDAILAERERQDKKWGTHFHGRTDERWLTILAEEFGEVAEAVLRNNDTDVVAELIQTAAVCVSWLEYRTAREEQMDAETPLAQTPYAPLGGE